MNIYTHYYVAGAVATFAHHARLARRLIGQAVIPSFIIQVTHSAPGANKRVAPFVVTSIFCQWRVGSPHQSYGGACVNVCGFDGGRCYCYQQRRDNTFHGSVKHITQLCKNPLCCGRTQARPRRSRFIRILSNNDPRTGRAHLPIWSASACVRLYVHYYDSNACGRARERVSSAGAVGRRPWAEMRVLIRFAPGVRACVSECDVLTKGGGRGETAQRAWNIITWTVNARISGARALESMS